MTIGITAKAMWMLFLAAVLALLVLPLLLVVVFSFNDSALTSFPLTGFTLHWYVRLFANESFWPSLTNSLVVGGVVSVLSVAVSLLAALGLARMQWGYPQAVLAVLSAPMMLPALIIGVALLSFFVRVIAVPLGLPTVILGQLVVIVPFVIAILHARLSSFDWSLVESARDLGASGFGAFMTVTLPIIRPTLIGSGLIALSLSLDDFVITFFTIGSGNTLPTLVWGLVRTALDPTINAIASLLLALSIGSTVLALKLIDYRR
ncbi:ABC transporter permease [Aestuariivirga sp.]|uniref:ABC transporter permease n=1 Tax=Aestuariivirga sp. TaxID=2650926 RepID=UPI003919E42A